MEEVINQTPELKSQVDVVKEKAKVKNSPFLIIMLVFFILLFGVLIYFFFTDKLIIVGIDNPLNKNEEQQENEEVIEENDQNIEEEIQEEDSLIEEDNNLLTYTSDERIGITFTYPDTWEVTKDEAIYQEDGTNDGDFFNLDLEITNKDDTDYVFKYSLPSHSGPETCVFDDTPEEYKNGVQITRLTNYEEFDNDNYRRAWKDDFNDQIICYGDRDEKIYSVWMDPGYAHFYVGDDNNQELINQMIDILLSMESREDLFDNVN